MRIVDWYDPEAWKTTAGAITAVVAAITAGVGAIAATTKKGRDLAKRTWSAIRPKSTRADLRFVYGDRAMFWGFAQIGDEQATQLIGTFQATNVSHTDVTLIKFRFRGLQTEHHQLIVGPGTIQPMPRNLLPRGYMSQVDIHCIARSCRCKPRQPFTADLIFTDNFGDEHKVKKVQFEYRGP
jgi:hypothetical protein